MTTLPAYRVPVTADDILDRQHSWRRREWDGIRAALREIGNRSASSPSVRSAKAPARRPPSARRGRGRLIGVVAFWSLVVLLALLAS